MGDFTRYMIRSTNRGLWTDEADLEAFIRLLEIAIFLVRNTENKAEGAGGEEHDTAKNRRSTRTSRSRTYIKLYFKRLSYRVFASTRSNTATIEAAVVGGLSRVGCGGALRIRWWGNKVVM